MVCFSLPPKRARMNKAINVARKDREANAPAARRKRQDGRSNRRGLVRLEADRADHPVPIGELAAQKVGGLRQLANAELLGRTSGSCTMSLRAALSFSATAAGV